MKRIARIGPLAAVLVGAVALTAFFWLPLWSGGGFVGGDVYSYYLPQKIFFAEALRSGEFPLWNSHTGHGYPLVGESQTAPFYPLNPLLYSLFDVHWAYHLSHLLHYIAAFVFCVIFYRTLEVGWYGSFLGAIVYVYGWFPIRNCNEWAIITGAYLPLSLFCVEKFLSTRYWRYAIGLSLSLGIQLLAGHFNIAFLTTLLLFVYIPLRLYFVPRTPRPERFSLFENGLETSNKIDPRKSSDITDAGHAAIVSPSVPRSRQMDPRLATLVLLGGAIACGYLLAAVQLVPTFELMRHSQRAATSGADGGLHRDEVEHAVAQPTTIAAPAFQMAQGSIPFRYLSQVVVPFLWYDVATNRDELLQQMQFGKAGTNQVEAHLFFGLGPLSLVGLALLQAFKRRNRFLLLWGGIALLSIIYSTGVLIPLVKSLPGFRFFQGPGRYGVLAQLAVGVLAGWQFDRILTSRSRVAWVVFVLGMFAATVDIFLLCSGADVAAEIAKTSTPIILAGLSFTEPLATSFCLLSLLVAVGAAFAHFRGANWGDDPESAPDRKTVPVSPIPKRSRNQRSSDQHLLTASVWSRLAGGLFLLVTVLELGIVARLVTYSPMVADPPLSHLSESTLRRQLAEVPGPPRIFAPGANLTTILGVASTPVYLPFGPAPYSDTRLLPPEEGPARRDWYERVGVTHLLTFASVDATSKAYLDPVLNPAWARFRESIYLTPLPNRSSSRGRVAWLGIGANAAVGGDQARIVRYTANRVEIDASTVSGGTLILTDLDFPGWEVAVDGQPAEKVLVEGTFRGVELSPGEHRITWSYRPGSLFWGGLASLATLLFLASVGHIRYWHPQWLFSATR